MASRGAWDWNENDCAQAWCTERDEPKWPGYLPSRTIGATLLPNSPMTFLAFTFLSRAKPPTLFLR